MKRILPLIIAFAILAAGLFFLLNREDSRTPALASPAPSPAEPVVEESASELTEETAPLEGNFAEAPRVPWPHEIGDIPATKRATFGALENGMRYVIIPNTEPPKRVSLRLHIDAGSLYEADDQQGVAHFLEHMVFNGSKNFPDPKQLIPQMQRLGIAFGAHANAYTSFDETVYMLDLPNLAEPTLDLAYTVMHDFADGALLKGEEIDKERGVILSEKNSRDSVQMRLMQQQFDFLIPDSLITKRFPIGIEEVIKNAVRERFVAFYEDYYVPKKMTFIVAGDVEVAKTEERIREAFASLENPTHPGAEPDLGEVPRGTGFRAVVFSDPEVATDDLSLLKVTAASPEVDSVALRLERQPLSVAHAILSRRFSILAKEEGSPIQSGSAAKGIWFQAMEFGSIDVTAVEGRWRDAVPMLEQELRRALEFGFTDSELNEIKAELLNAYEQAVKREATRSSDEIAMEVVATINELGSLSSPAEDLRIAQMGMDELTPAGCHEALKAFWDTADLTLILTTTVEEENTQPELLSLYQGSTNAEVAPPVQKETAVFAYTQFGPTGAISAEKRIEDLDATQLVLSNGVRVNFKRTEFEKNSISLLARMGSGQLSMPHDKPGLTQLAGALLNAGGLGEHSEDELRRILAGVNVGAGFAIEEDALTLSGSTTPEDLTRQLQLMCAYLTDPGFREEAMRQYQNALPGYYDQLRHDLGGAQAQLSQWLHGDDARFATPELTVAQSYTAEDVQQWLMPQITGSYLELSLVGDFDPEELKAALLTTFGAIPAREEKPVDYPLARKMEFPKTPNAQTFTYQSEIPRAAALVLWGIPGVGDNIAQARRFNIMAEILGDRMRKEIREELGATYSPSTGSSPSEVFPEFGNLIGFSIAKPEDLVKINEITVELGAALARDGADEDELERALKPTLSQLESSLRENSYWLGTVLSRSQQDPTRLDWARQRDEDYANITLEEINELAATYLQADNAIKVELKPEASAPTIP